MRVEFDPTKNERNIRERDLPFERAAEFDFETAIYLSDDRRDYGEMRIVAVGYLGRRLRVPCFVEIADGIRVASFRVASFRKANLREAKKHGKTLTLNQ